MTLEPRPIDGWEIELTGLIEPRRVTIGAEELLEMDQVEYEMILQCSGNGRSMYGGIQGTPWNQGGVANVRFAGVTAEGGPREARRHGRSPGQVRHRRGPRRAHGTGSCRTSSTACRWQTSWTKSILALELNGEPLPGIHGGPVRLVTPGFFGTMQIKWLARLRFETAESPSFYHANEYRVPLEPSSRARRSASRSRTAGRPGTSS